jgi:prepilin-type N-terminal cleavage/methylation domain-containing protein
MRRRGQRGMTVVEVLVAMAVTAVVLVGLTGVLSDVTGYYQDWADRLDDASTGAAVASAIQQDSERYIPCHTTSRRLDFCVPGSNSTAATYAISPDGSAYSILRQSLPNGSTVLMARGATAATWFWSECILGPGTVSGHVHVYQFRGDTQTKLENFSVYYHAPIPPGGSCP